MNFLKNDNIAIQNEALLLLEVFVKNLNQSNNKEIQ
jgi:hypothetical protein